MTCFMAIISLRQLLDHAAENNYGVPAFNVNNLEQIRAIMEGAYEMNSPVIVQASAGARKYAGPKFIKSMMEAAVDEFPNIPLVMHQDHGGSTDDCKKCIDLGFSSVMMDGSLLEDQKTPSDFEYNVKVTKETVEIAHKLGVSVEGELGCLGSLETGMGEKEDGVGAEGVLSHEQLLTDPEEAVNFVNQTHVDALAIAIGTSHGAYKFTRPPTGDILAIERIKEIHKRIPNTHLVMHGSSSVPQDLLKIINDNGGNIKETYGVPVKEIQEGIKHGVRKVNIDTDLRLASTAAIRKHFAKDPAQFDPRKYLIETKDAMKKIVMDRLEEFGTAGNADKIKPFSLTVIASKYLSGTLSPKIN
jgi:fructose-bisphosphate aldolase class II